MSRNAKREYYLAILPRYKKASKKEKSLILDEFCRVCQYNRDYASHKLKNPHPPIKHKKRGRTSKYNIPTVITPIKKIWLAANLPCSKNLVALLPLWIPHYETTYGKIDKLSKELILTISASTIDRIFKKFRHRHTKHGLSTTKPGSLLKKHIPIKTSQWDESRPGFVEVDTVAHCGDHVDGHYAFTLDMLDIATSWSEQRATWGKGERGTLEAILSAEKTLPFPLLGFDSDQGSEFFNWHVYRNLTERKSPVEFTCSRAYKKNDNAHIEQKNWTHVRQLIGYERFDFPQLVTLLNDLYTQEWRLYFNGFIPSVKLIEKKRIGSHNQKKHDKPQTPLQRIIAHPNIPEETKTRLKKQFDNLNPFLLRNQINKKIRHIFATLKRLNKKRLSQK